MTLNYHELARVIDSLTHGETDTVALMATIACEVHHADDRFDWTGFYRVVAPGLLKIGPYQGGHGCLVIPFSRGVCGAAARTLQVQLVPDVDAFPGHIACASSTRSELVLPVVNRAGGLIAVFDIDSNRPDAFTAEDATQIAAILNRCFADVPTPVFGQVHAPDREAGHIVRKGARRSVGSSPAGLTEELLSPDLTGGFQMVLCTFEPGAILAEPVVRSTQEVGFVISGRLELWIDDTLHHLNPGDSFRIGGTPFRWANSHATPAVVIRAIAPPVH